MSVCERAHMCVYACCVPRGDDYSEVRTFVSVSGGRGVLGLGSGLGFVIASGLEAVFSSARTGAGASSGASLGDEDGGGGGRALVFALGLGFVLAAGLGAGDATPSSARLGMVLSLVDFLWGTWRISEPSFGFSSGFSFGFSFTPSFLFG